MKILLLVGVRGQRISCSSQSVPGSDNGVGSEPPHLLRFCPSRTPVTRLSQMALEAEPPFSRYGAVNERAFLRHGGLMASAGKLSNEHGRHQGSQLDPPGGPSRAGPGRSGQHAAG